MRKLTTILIGSLLLASCTTGLNSSKNQIIDAKLYVAIEGENRIAVLNPSAQEVVKTIDLSERVGDVLHEFSPHNVQVAPDGESVWVTANYGQGSGHEGGDSHMASEVADQVIVIDSHTDTIRERIPIDLGVHLAHVVVSKDSSFAYATAQEKGVIYKIDARSFKIVEEITAPEHSEPHGLRISSDGTIAYIALLQGKGLGMLDMRSDTLTIIPLDGNAVQTAVTPDGEMALVSLYDTKKIAVFDIQTRNVSYVTLPKDSKGPIQMYPTPDSHFLYVADQGYYFDQPTGNRVYKIDLLSRSVVKEIPVGDAPHGVVVSSDGKAAYITNLLTQDVSIIDTTLDTEVGRIKVGTQPNGISLWSQFSGGTP